MAKQKKLAYMLPIILIVVSVLLFAFFTGSAKQSSNEKISVVTSLFPLYEFAKEVGGDKVDATLLLPPGAEAHTFEPKLSDIQKINHADVFVYIGAGMEPWMQDILDGVDAKNLTVVDSSKYVKLLPAAKIAPYEWSGVYTLKKGTYIYNFDASDEEAMNLGVISYSGNNYEKATAEFSQLLETVQSISAGQEINVDKDSSYTLQLNPNGTKFTITIANDGDYLFYTQHNPEEMNMQLIDGNNTVLTADIKEELDIHGANDPHIWTDFENDQKIVNALAETLSEKDPANKGYYMKNAQEYNGKLAAIDDKFKAGLKTCKTRTFINGGHKAFEYFNKRYNLTEIAVYGIIPDSEPSPRKIEEIYSAAKANNVKYVFVERLVNPKIGEVIATEIGGQVLTLNAGHNLQKDQIEKGVTLISLMEENLQNLKIGLECE